MTLSDEDVRHLAIELLTAPTERDQQRSIGASNLANGCDYCLACAFMNISRDTPITDRAWGGRVLGTAIHSILESRMNEALATLDYAKLEFTALPEPTPGTECGGGPDDWDQERDALEANWRAKGKQTISSIAQRFPDALAEHHMSIGIMGTYGPVGSTADLVLPGERHAFDWKGSTRAKLAILADFLAIQQGLPAPYGRKHAVHKAKTLSETVYAEELAKLEFKITGYYSQLQTYGLGLEREGTPVDRLSIVFISRDDTMWFDNPASDGYNDPKKLHGIVVLSFNYDKEYAEQVWARGLSIWEGLEGGKTVSDFARSAQCFPCGLDARDHPVSDAPIIIPALATNSQEETA